MKYTVVANASEIPPRRTIGLDTEGRNDGTGLMHPAHMDLTMVQIADSPRHAYIATEGFENLKWLEDSLVIGQNLQYDYQQLKHHAGIKLNKVFDTMVVEGLIDAATPGRYPHSLRALSLKYLGKDRDKDIRADFAQGRSVTPQMLEYAAEDATDVLKIEAVQWKELKRVQPSSDVFKLEMRALTALAEMIYAGIPVDKRKWRRQDKKRRVRLAELKISLSQRLEGSTQRDMFGGSAPSVNLNSHVVLKRLLRQNGIEVPNTQAPTLEAYSQQYTGKRRQILKDLVEASALRKLVSTYGETWLRWVSSKTKRVHASFFQTKAKTGRMSSADPNLQNIPIRTELGREIRNCFIAPDGYCWIKADYAQQEIRILAALSRDKTLLDAFEAGVDPYAIVARMVFNDNSINAASPERNLIKPYTLGMFYGMGAQKLAWGLGCGVPQGQSILNRFAEMFPDAYGLAQSIIEVAERTNYSETVLGRRRFGSPVEPRFVGQMRNMPIQGTAAEMMKLAAVIFASRIDWQTIQMVNDVHDEIDAIAKLDRKEEAAKLIEESMLDAAYALVDVPFKVDVAIGKYWEDNSYGTV